MTSREPGDRAFEETSAGAVQGGGEQNAAGTDEGSFDAGEFVIDHDAAPPEEEQPTTS
jgi:hypothetical protein